MERAAYVRAVLDQYLKLTDTPQLPRRHDHRVAQDLHHPGVPLTTVRAALILASARRRTRPPGAAPLAPIRSLAYFLPVVEEVEAVGVPEGYVGYLEGLLERGSRIPRPRSQGKERRG